MKELPSLQLDWCECISQQICIEQGSGILRYYGKIKGCDGIWFGIELDEATGQNNGSINGIKYFTCKDQHGIFIPESSPVEVITLTKSCNKENSSLNHAEFQTDQGCVGKKECGSSFKNIETSITSTEKENLCVDSVSCFPNHLMMEKFSCKLSPLKEESLNCINNSDLNATVVLKSNYDLDQRNLMKTFTLEESTFDAGNEEKVLVTHLAGKDKDNSDLTGTDDSLGILPSLINDSEKSWDLLTVDDERCRKNQFSDFKGSLSPKKGGNDTEKEIETHTVRPMITFPSSYTEEDSLVLCDVDSPTIDNENLPLCASTPKHQLFFTNFNETNMGLNVPKNCSAFAVSGDSTLGLKKMQEQVFNFSDISLIEDANNRTFMQHPSESLCLNTNGLSHKISKTELFKLGQEENFAFVPDTAEVVSVTNKIKSNLNLSATNLNSMFDENSDQGNLVCNDHDITISNKLSKTFNMNNKTVTRQKKSSDLSESLEHQKLQFHDNTFTAEHFDCVSNSLLNNSGNEKIITEQSELSHQKNLSKTIKTSISRPIQNKSKFGFKSGKTERPSGLFKKNNFMKTRQSLSAVPDLKHGMDHSFNDKNKSKYKRQSLSTVKDKSNLLPNSTAAIRHTNPKNIRSGELSKKSIALDALKLPREKRLSNNILHKTSCKPRIEETSTVLSEELSIKKLNSSKSKRNLLPRIQDKSNMLLNSTVIIPHTSPVSIHSRKLSKNSTTLDSAKLTSSIGLDKSLISNILNKTSCKPCVKETADLSEESNAKKLSDHSKSKRTSLSSSEDKSDLFLNSTITIPHNSSESLHSRELCKNSISDSLELPNSSISETRLSCNILNKASCIVETSAALSEEPTKKQNDHSVNVSHATSTKSLNFESNSASFVSNNDDKNVHCARNSVAFSKNDVDQIENFTAANISKHLNIDFVTERKECSSELNTTVLIKKNSDESTENVLNGSIVCTDVPINSTQQPKESLEVINSLTVTKKGSYKEFVSTLNAKNLKTSLSTSLCSTSRIESLSKSVPKKLNTSAFGPVKTIGKKSSFESKMPPFFRLTLQNETSKVRNNVGPQLTGSIFNKIDASKGSNARVTNLKTAVNFKKHSFNQINLGCSKNSFGKSINSIKNPSNLRFKLDVEARSSECSAVTITSKPSLEQNKKGLPKKANDVEDKACMKGHTLSLKRDENFSKTKLSAVTRVSGLNPNKFGTSKLPSLQNHNQITTVDRNKESIQPSYSCRKSVILPKKGLRPEKTKDTTAEKSDCSKIKSQCCQAPYHDLEDPHQTGTISRQKGSKCPGTFKKDSRIDKHELVSNKEKAPTKSESAASNVPKQRLGIPKLFSRTTTGCEKNGENLGRKLKSPCRVKKRP